jgi:hypothetical protein
MGIKNETKIAKPQQQHLALPRLQARAAALLEFLDFSIAPVAHRW